MVLLATPSIVTTIVSVARRDDGNFMALVTWMLDEQLNDDCVTEIPAYLEPMLT